MYHFTYKITNNLNNKIYVGVHSTSSIDDGYMGSGIGITAAISKYGIANFHKEILEFFTTADKAYESESTIVNQDFINRADTYNASLGGRRGPGRTAGYVLSDNQKIRISHKLRGRVNTPEQIDRWKKSFEENKHNHDYSYTSSEEWILKMSSRESWTLSDQSKANIGAAAKRRWDDPEYRLKISDRLCSGESHHRFTGWFVTPVGNFASANAASIATGIGRKTISSWCKNNKNGYSFITKMPS